MYKVKFTNIAEKDLNESYDYLRSVLKNPIAAENLINETESVFSRIVQTPNICSLVNDSYLRNLGIRFLLILNYVAFIKINEEEKEVVVVRFLYGKREWKNILKDKES